MKQNIRLSLLFMAVVLANLAYGQDDVAALRFSSNLNTGTARSLGMAGSFGAAGADFSNISTNPAGLAFFRSNQVSFSTNAFISGSKTQFGNTEETRLSGKFGLNSFGGIFPIMRNPKNDRRPTSKVKNYFFGIGFNRLANYSHEFGFNNQTRGTILEYYTATAQGKTPAQMDQLNEGLAYNAFLLYADAGSTNYEADLNGSNTTMKTGSFKSEGRNNEMAIAFGANLSHKWYLGGAIGVPFISYGETFSYREQDDLNQDSVFNSLQLINDFNTDGLGINAKGGIIYRFNKYIRVGASFTSPTRLGLTDDFTSSLVSDLNYPYPETNVVREGNPDDLVGSFDYGLRTPWKAMLSAAYFFGKSGFINIDAEYVDYNSMRYRFDASENPSFAIVENELNTGIRNKYKGAINLKVGAEYAYEKFRLRGGIALFGSPFESSVPVDFRPHLRFTGGIGYYWKRSFIDFAYGLDRSEENFVPYSVENSTQQLVTKDRFDHQLSFTFGFRLGGSRDGE